MRKEGESNVNMFDTIVESDNESSQSEAGGYDALRYNECYHEQLKINWHPILNMVTIVDEEIHLRRPSDEDVKNLTKAAIAKAKHNYNLRSSKRDGDQGEPGSMFMKEVSHKITTINNASPLDGHTKGDQSKDLGKGAENSAIANSLGTTKVKKVGQPKIEKAKAHTEPIVSSMFDMT